MRAMASNIGGPMQSALSFRRHGVTNGSTTGVVDFVWVASIDTVVDATEDACNSGCDGDYRAKGVERDGDETVIVTSIWRDTVDDQDRSAIRTAARDWQRWGTLAQRPGELRTPGKAKATTRATANAKEAKSVK